MKDLFEGVYLKHQKNGESICFIAGRAGETRFVQVITNGTVRQYDGAQGFCFVYPPLLLCQQCYFLLECDFCRFLFRIKPLRSCPQPFTACAERFLRQEQLFPCNLRLLGCPSQSRACRFLLRLFLLPFRLRNGIFRQRRLMGMVRCAADRASHPLREVFR